MTELAKALRSVRRADQQTESTAPVPTPYLHQPRLSRSRILFTPFEAWLLAMAVSFVQAGVLALMLAVRG